MRPALFITLILAAFATKAQQYHLSISNLFEAKEVAYLFPPDGYSALEGGLMLQAEGIYGESLLRYGWFVDYVPTNYVYRYDFDLKMLTIGGMIGIGYEEIDDLELQAFLQIGYRNTSVANGQDTYNGLALNFQMNGIYLLDGDIHPKVNFGFHTQPDGGNDDVSFTYGTQWYFGAGIVYQK